MSVLAQRRGSSVDGREDCPAKERQFCVMWVIVLTPVSMRTIALEGETIELGERELQVLEL